MANYSISNAIAGQLSLFAVFVRSGSGAGLTSFTVTNSDGTQTTFTGTNLTWNGATATAGVLTSIVRRSADGSTVLDQVTGFSAGVNDSFVTIWNQSAEARLSYIFAGADSLNGGAGDDLFFDAGAGNDTYTGGAGSDTIDYSATSANISIILTASNPPVAISAQIGTDFLNGIENIFGGDGDDSFTGEDAAVANEFRGNGGADQAEGRGGADKLYGDDGDDALYGGDGDDFLYGGSGRDLLSGGAGNDALDGGSGRDIAYFNGATAAVTATLAPDGSATVSAAGIGTDTLTGFEGLRGGDLGDTLTGNADQNLLHGGRGNDTLTGGGGADMFVFIGFELLGGTADTIADFGADDTIFVLNKAYYDISVAGVGGAPVVSLLVPGGAATIRLNGYGADPVQIASTAGFELNESTIDALTRRNVELTFHDWADSTNYVRYTDLHDQDGQRYRQIGAYDDAEGSWDFLWNVSLSGVSWSSRFDFFNAAGQKIEQQGVYLGASGSWIERYDPAGVENYTVTITYFDTMLRPVQVQSFYDAGGRGITTFDPVDVADYEQYTTYYTAGGAADTQNGVYDEGFAGGRSWWVDFDNDNVQPWQTHTVIYDALGAVLHQWLTMDDGTIFPL